MEKTVDEYIEKQPTPQKETCKRLRRIILKTFPDIREEMKMGVPWYGKFYIVALKDSVNLGFSVRGLSKEDAANFKGAGKCMRHLKYSEPNEIDGKRIVELLKLVDEKARCASRIK